jgi:enoyl-CoA hydratase/carnithine racemase
MDAAEGERWGFYNALVEPDALLAEAQSRAAALANGPALAHAMTKRMLLEEWHVPVAEAQELEAQAQAACIRTVDFQRAFRAFTEKRTPTFEGN